MATGQGVENSASTVEQFRHGRQKLLACWVHCGRSFTVLVCDLWGAKQE